MNAIPANQQYHGEAPPAYAQQAGAPPGHETAYCKGVSLDNTRGIV